MEKVVPYIRPTEKRELVGVDVFIVHEGSVEDLRRLAWRCDQKESEKSGMLIEMIDNRGMVVWPEAIPNVFCSDLFRVRYRRADDSKREITHQDITKLLDCISFQRLEFVKVELLYNFDGKPGFTRGQGQ